MSRNYKFHNIEGLYFVSFAVEETGWSIKKKWRGTRYNRAPAGGEWEGTSGTLAPAGGQQ